jgi:prepilin-type N-terminal cleavage/methylation domain-containing protein
MVELEDSKGFSLIELMIVVAIISIMSATAMSLFRNYSARSRTAEATLSVAKIAEAEVGYYQRFETFVEAGPSNIPPSSSANDIDFTVGNWQVLGFSLSGASLFGYQTTLTGAASVDCEAQGDQDGDGNPSIFTRSVEVSPGMAAPQMGPILVVDELE